MDVVTGKPRRVLGNRARTVGQIAPSHVGEMIA